MTIHYINTGSGANRGDGDTLRTAFNKINQTFSFLEVATGIKGTEDLIGSMFTNNTGTTGIISNYNGATSSISLSLTTATSSTLGGVIVGDNLTIDNNGRLNSNEYILPTATSSTLGGVKVVGNGIKLSNTGTISVELGNFVFTGSSVSVANFQSLKIVSTSTVSIGSPSTSFIVDSASRAIIMPSGSTIKTSSNGLTFGLQSVSFIQFSDNSMQTSAASSNISSLSNNSFYLRLDSTGTTHVPSSLVFTPLSYQAYVPTVNSSTVVITVLQTPHPGWTFNGVTILSVTPLSVNWQLELESPVNLFAGLYPLIPVPGIGGSIVFPNGSIQSSAWNTSTQIWPGQIIGGIGNGSVIQSDSAPTASTSTLWYDTISGRSFVYFGNSWVDSNPNSQLTSTISITTLQSIISTCTTFLEFKDAILGL